MACRLVCVRCARVGYGSTPWVLRRSSFSRRIFSRLESSCIIIQTPLQIKQKPRASNTCAGLESSAPGSAHLKDTDVERATWRVDTHGVTRAVIHQRATERRFVRDAAITRVGFGRP